VKSIQISDFKARCLALIAEVERSGQSLTILKRGRPVAQVVPVVPREERYPQDTLAGTVEVLGDVVSPVLPASAWEAQRRRRK
jgi:prevent-host-death family protein